MKKVTTGDVCATVAQDIVVQKSDPQVPDVTAGSKCSPCAVRIVTRAFSDSRSSSAEGETSSAVRNETSISSDECRFNDPDRMSIPRSEVDYRRDFHGWYEVTAEHVEFLHEAAAAAIEGDLKTGTELWQRAKQLIAPIVPTYRAGTRYRVEFTDDEGAQGRFSAVLTKIRAWKVGSDEITSREAYPLDRSASELCELAFQQWGDLHQRERKHRGHLRFRRS